MKSNRRGVIVGLFVFIGLAILLAGILFLGGQQKRFVSTIEIKAVFNDVGGLKTGNNVWFSGVKIGTIKRIRFVGSSKVEVDMNIEEKSAQYIRKDAQATLGSDGLIGNKLIVIVGGSLNTPSVEEGDMLRAREALSMESIIDTLQVTNRNLLKITTDIGSIVNRVKNGRGLAGLLLNDTAIVQNFRGSMVSLQQASANAAKMTGSLTTFTAKLNRPGTLANDLITDTTIMRNVRTSTANLQRASVSANDVVADVKQTTEKLKNGNSALGVLTSDVSVGNDIRSTVRNLNSSTQKLDENLEALKSNFLFRGYFRKQEKAKVKAAKEAEKNGTPMPADSTK
ncbi:MlaD family protein [Fibrella aquatica]|jgi:phospholipid/cholesterol/gamma-HCH transport system substrate-binding protein|uniref:MlaD family protein n=1 Tax=Fibrella aquatica TaxID=3242487 RepID=UPI00352299CF